MPVQRFTYLDKKDMHTLLNSIAHKLTLSKKRAKQLLDKRVVFVNKRRVWIASYQLNKGDVIEVITEETKLPDLYSGDTGTRFQKDSILFKDDHYLIVSKPPNILTNGHESLEANLKTRFHNNHIREQRAVTHVKLLKRGKNASYLEVQIETGRSHQIRIHPASVGYQVIGEREYNRRSIENQLLRRVERHMLHAYQISFIHPYTREAVAICRCYSMDIVL